MKTKRIGMIGFGEMGKRHAQEFDEATGGLIVLSGVYEPDDVKFREGCEWARTTPDRYATPEELIEKGKLDGMVIASPNHRHYDNLRLLEGRTLPVLIEKPLDADPNKICEIMRFAQRYRPDDVRRPGLVAVRCPGPAHALRRNQPYRTAAGFERHPARQCPARNRQRPDPERQSQFPA